MKNPKDSYENILLEMLPEPLKQLPSHWQQIYHEGIYGRHILFDSAELKDLSGDETQEQDSTGVDKTVLRLLEATGLSEMRAIVNACSKAKRRILFQLYQRHLQRTKEQLRCSLN